MEKYRKVEVKLGKPNVETLTSKGLKLTDVMKVKKINVLSQEEKKPEVLVVVLNYSTM